MTEIQQSQFAQAAADRFQSLVKATSLVVWNTNPDGAVITPMPSWSAYTGKVRQTFKGGDGLTQFTQRIAIALPKSGLTPFKPKRFMKRTIGCWEQGKRMKTGQVTRALPSFW